MRRCTNFSKFINGPLKDDFDLDILAKSKPVMGVDDLLLGLTHHWSQDTSIFPTEDDRLDLPTIMLFQAYTACRPAELVDGTKSRGDKDPLLDDPKDEYADAQMLDVQTINETFTSQRTPRVKIREPTLTCDHEGESDFELDSEFDLESDFDEALFDKADGYDSDVRSDTYSNSSDDGGESDGK